MDLDSVRAAITLVSFLAFVGIVLWAWSGRRKARFDEAANLPFADDDLQRATLEAERREAAVGGPRREDRRHGNRGGATPSTPPEESR